MSDRWDDLNDPERIMKYAQFVLEWNKDRINRYEEGTHMHSYVLGQINAFEQILAIKPLPCAAKPSHECINCGNVVRGKNPTIIDGLRCPACGGPIVPITIPRSVLQGLIKQKEGPRADGLTTEEGEVMDHLIDAWSAYIKLPRQHPNELKDFADPLHRIQDLLAFRVCQRCFPKGWPIKQ